MPTQFREDAFLTRANLIPSLNVSSEQLGEAVLLPTRSEGVSIVVAKSPAASGDTRPCLASIRAVVAATSADHSKFLALATQQAIRLQEKLHALDKLRLSSILFSGAFRASRVMIVSNSAHTTETWTIALERLLEYSSNTKSTFFAQPDYDQMSALPEVESALGTARLHSRHWPSALGTNLIFSEVLFATGRSFKASSAGLVGVGNVGRRIADGLLDRGIRKLVLCDTRADALRPFTDNSRIMFADLDQIPQMNLDLLIFSANSGTLSVDLARKLASAKHRPLAVGGPEAGLDSARDAIDVLVKAGVSFVPSYLCGAYGLCASLEEAVGIVNPSETKLDSISHEVRNALGCAREHKLPFHVALKFALSQKLPAYSRTA